MGERKNASRTKQQNGIRYKEPRGNNKNAACFQAMRSAGYIPASGGDPTYWGFDADFQMVAVYALKHSSLILNPNQRKVAFSLDASGVNVFLWSIDAGFQRYRENEERDI